MTTHRIAVIGGDGIGPDVTKEALRVVRAAGVDLATTDFDLGAARYLRDGFVLDDATLQEFPDPALGVAVFAAPEGIVGEPVKTTLGWQVVRVANHVVVHFVVAFEVGAQSFLFRLRNRRVNHFQLNRT